MTSLTRAWPLMMVARVNLKGHEPQGSKSHLLVPPRDEEERRGLVSRAQHLAHFFDEVPRAHGALLTLGSAFQGESETMLGAGEKTCNSSGRKEW